MPLPTRDPDDRTTRGYRVFARHSRDPSLHECGEVHATSVDDAVVFAHSLYDERRWSELFVVPGDAVVTLIEVE